MLRNIGVESNVAKSEKWMEELIREPVSRKKIVALLQKLNHPDAYDICSLLKQAYIPYTRKVMMLFRVLQCLPLFLLCLFLITKYSFLIIALIIIFLVNLTIHYTSKNIAFVYSGSMPQLYSLLVIAEKLNDIPLSKKINPLVADSLKKTKVLRQKLSVFRFDVKMDSEMAVFAWGITELIKIFFLFDPINLNRAFTLINEYKGVLREIFDYVGLIDSLQSVITMRELNPVNCRPQFTQEVAIDTVDIYHPLIPACVSNSFRISRYSLLVLGSNMSGKTSFIRTVGVNVILAQTLNTCFASKMALPYQQVFSSIAMEDSLMQGQSYYLREVLRMKYILDQTKTGVKLILLDELFRGTNTIERIAGAKAVLNFLAMNDQNLILVATHDIELVELLKDKYQPVYFTENIVEDKLSFSYKLHYERNPQRNAIRILELYGYPEDLVKDAMQTI